MHLELFPWDPLQRSFSLRQREHAIGIRRRIWPLKLSVCDDLVHVSLSQSISASYFYPFEPGVRILLSYILAAELSIVVLACGIAVFLLAFLSASLGSEQERPFFSQRSQSNGHVRLMGRHFLSLRTYHSLRNSRVPFACVYDTYRKITCEAALDCDSLAWNTLVHWYVAEVTGGLLLWTVADSDRPSLLRLVFEFVC